MSEERQLDFIYWGDGESLIRNNQKKQKVVFGFTDNKVIQKMYFYGDTTLYISNGDIYKEGKLKFEPASKKDKKTEKEMIVLKSSNMLLTIPVTDMVFGSNHILILTVQGSVFSWGDNYYGQLGLGNCVLPAIFEPQHITKLEAVDKIIAYNNNSFAITSSKKLFSWGSSEYIGQSMKCNLYRPFLVNSNYIFNSLKINNNSIIAKVTKLVDTPDILFEEKQKEKATEEDNEKVNDDNDDDDKQDIKIINEIKRINGISIDYYMTFDTFYENFIDEIIIK